MSKELFFEYQQAQREYYEDRKIREEMIDMGWDLSPVTPKRTHIVDTDLADFSKDFSIEPNTKFTVNQPSLKTD